MIYICLGIICLMLLGAIWAYCMEKKDWNNGSCPDCNIEWRNFDMDSQGGRGYTCDKCDKTIWISWLRVDKDCG